MIRAAVVGLGWWGRTIVRTMQGSEALAITTAVDIVPSAASVAAAHGLRFQPDFAVILKDPAVDAVILCTPHTQHSHQIEQAAASGKHVFCEKPLCVSRVRTLSGQLRRASAIRSHSGSDMNDALRIT